MRGIDRGTARSPVCSAHPGPATTRFEEKTVPANRSRTLNWRRCLQQIHERNGAIEIAVARHYTGSEQGSHLIWRVRLLDVSETEVVVEQPMTLGQRIPIRLGVELVAVVAVGQNRWMFSTANVGMHEHRLNDRKSIPAMRLLIPDRIERCQRRNYYRVHTASLNLPDVDLWPLLDPRSVLLAERANELQIKGEAGIDIGDCVPDDGDADPAMPEVGPKFRGKLLNLGGGGVGIRVEPGGSQSLLRHKIFWVRFALPPELTVPICSTGKLIHTHLDSTQHVYAGMAFDFTFNPEHQSFVVEQICQYLAVQQRLQLQRRREQEERKTA
jgi:c-di-GMP-binding flagellar brake protein YcgR